MECRITGMFFDLIKSLQEEQKKPKDYGTGHLLFHAEVNFLDTISRNPSANVSEISAALGITKGAVTQLVNRLTEKGLVESYHSPNNKKTKYLRLTSLGEKAQQGHLEFHKKANDQMRNYLCTRNEHEMTIILDFLKQMNECIPFCEFDCSQTGNYCYY